MLIRLQIENWKSFKDLTEFSMIGSAERQHNKRVPKIKKYPVKILPISVIYGGNASGKSNFIEFFRFIREFIVSGTEPDENIRTETFLLDETAKKSPSFFKFELLINEIIYEFSFKIDFEKVIEEQLIKITSSSETVLFSRKNKKISFCEKYKDKDFFRFTAEGTRKNQLFLTNTVFQNIDDFKPVYDWFARKLKIIFPESKYRTFERFFDKNDPLSKQMKDTICKLDTGITGIGSVEIDIKSIPIPDFIINNIKKVIKKADTVGLSSGRDKYIFTMENESLKAKKLVTYHGNTEFDLENESDGTQRLFDILPALLGVSSEDSDSVLLIDEVDRSLHPILINKLIKAYLESFSQQTRSQIIMTTHNLSLMTQDIFRRDEIWITERDHNGVTSILSFNDFKGIRNDKDIRKNYFLGRMGGIPNISLDRF